MNDNDTNGHAVPSPAPTYPMVCPTRILPRPVVQSIGLGMVRGDDGVTYVVMQVATPVGLYYLYLQPDEAMQVGNGLVQLGSKTGIAIVSENSPLAQALADAAFAKRNK